LHITWPQDEPGPGSFRKQGHLSTNPIIRSLKLGSSRQLFQQLWPQFLFSGSLRPSIYLQFQFSTLSLLLSTSTNPRHLCCLCSPLFLPLCSLELFSCPLITAATCTSLGLIHCLLSVLPSQSAVLMIKTKGRQEKTTEEKPFVGPNIAAPRCNIGVCVLLLMWP
jgi:hypothetical protein